MRNLFLKTALVCASLFAACFAVAGSGVGPANHSFNVIATPTVSGTTVSFVGTPTEAGAVNVPFTGQVCYNGAVYNGSTFTFTSIGQLNTFSVTLPGGVLPPGASANLTISVTDGNTATCNNGGNGYLANFVVIVPAPPVPAMNGVSLALLAALIAAAGLFLRRRA